MAGQAGRFFNSVSSINPVSLWRTQNSLARRLPGEVRITCTSQQARHGAGRGSVSVALSVERGAAEKGGTPTIRVAVSGILHDAHVLRSAAAHHPSRQPPGGHAAEQTQARHPSGVAAAGLIVEQMTVASDQNHQRRGQAAIGDDRQHPEQPLRSVLDSICSDGKPMTPIADNSRLKPGDSNCTRLRAVRRCIPSNVCPARPRLLSARIAAWSLAGRIAPRASTGALIDVTATVTPAAAIAWVVPAGRVETAVSVFGVVGARCRAAASRLIKEAFSGRGGNATSAIRFCASAALSPTKCGVGCLRCSVSPRSVP